MKTKMFLPIVVAIIFIGVAATAVILISVLLVDSGFLLFPTLIFFLGICMLAATVFVYVRAGGVRSRGVAILALAAALSALSYLVFRIHADRHKIEPPPSYPDGPVAADKRTLPESGSVTNSSNSNRPISKVKPHRRKK